MLDRSAGRRGGAGAGGFGARRVEQQGAACAGNEARDGAAAGAAVWRAGRFAAGVCVRRGGLSAQAIYDGGRAVSAGGGGASDRQLAPGGQWLMVWGELRQTAGFGGSERI